MYPRYDEWLHMMSGKLRAVKRVEGVCKPGQYVLAGWVDGEHYPARVRSVNRKNSKYDLIFYSNLRKSIDFSNVSPITVDEYKKMVAELKSQEEVVVMGAGSGGGVLMRECGYCGGGVSDLTQCLSCHRSCCSSCYSCQQVRHNDDDGGHDDDNQQGLNTNTINNHNPHSVHHSNSIPPQSTNLISNPPTSTSLNTTHIHSTNPIQTPTHPQPTNLTNSQKTTSTTRQSINPNLHPQKTSTNLPQFFTCLICFLSQDGVEGRLMDGEATKLTIRLEQLLGVASLGVNLGDGGESGEAAGFENSNNNINTDGNKNFNKFNRINEILDGNDEDILSMSDCDDDDDVIMSKIEKKVEEIETKIAMQFN